MSETAKIKNLWGDLPVEKNIRTPYIILKEQASILTEATNGILVGNVLKKANDDESNPQVTCVLEIKVPSINNYSISIVGLLYPMLTIYPAKIMNIVKDTIVNDNCQNEESIHEFLGKILSSEEVRRIISALLNEARSDTVKEQ